MSKFKCKVCGYIYTEEDGEAKKDIPAGTAWDDISNSFKCPACGAAKRMFKNL